MKTSIEHIAFPTRIDRSRYVAQRFAPYFGQSLLDVGCFEAPLREILQDVDYTGVDFVGSPDIELNLEQTERLPFGEASFDCVTCIDVLEHLENLHSIFDELVRVARRHVIVSLPNCWRDARLPIARGCGEFLHYGLALEKPLDRHKWFFNFSQARDFLSAQADAHDLDVAEMFGTEKPKNPLLRQMRKIRFPGERYVNRYVQTAWAVFRKREN